MTMKRSAPQSHDTVDLPSLSARALEPHTKSVFLEAGVEPGMRVLDAWSGAGDVAFVLREIVGPYGHVTGFDNSIVPVAHASERAARRGFSNVEFVEAEIDDLPLRSEFDAIVGRMVLMYRLNPAADLKALARFLRPGGLMVFQELDLLTGKTVPAIPIIEEIVDWMLVALARAGIDVEMGHRLYQTFKAAGFDPPRMAIDGVISGVEGDVPTLFTNVVRTLAPQLEAQGAATPDQLQIETLEQRIRAALASSGGVISMPLLISAWSRVAG